jgi:hypothetical protein
MLLRVAERFCPLGYGPPSESETNCSENKKKPVKIPNALHLWMCALFEQLNKLSQSFCKSKYTYFVINLLFKVIIFFVIFLPLDSKYLSP